MRRTKRFAVLSAVALAAALGLCGCGADEPQTPPPPAATEPPPIATSPPTVPDPGSTSAPLPPPEALTDVLARIADANIPGAEKLHLIEDATAADGESMDKFAVALRDGGYAPATFEARDLTWSDGANGVVQATVTVRTANPEAGEFTFPMEFRLAGNQWQLTRSTTDALLQLGPAPTPTPTP
ncbi:hypothetical protein H7I77_17430 [Mycolicibacterium novocastrense]|uniref:LppK protein n=1 Tax=Mycolicibacterium novocastrense TaxID=59813 RepID=A0AAW5SNJ4_MYCNV|nr:hypothetical protein [Mycolicibacterium novocastrense]MCV7025107.1 hypothetical protein [Mycolicibacterium novocastrense]GAT09244.1 LppK protein [Mycolicibacterium novocastrense]